MAHNGREVRTMERIRYGWLWSMLCLLMSLSGCSYREMLDDYPVSGVRIALDWEGVTKNLPQTMRVIFYPKDADGRKVDSYISSAGGEMKVPPGRYAVVIYNIYEVETSVQIEGEDSYETIRAFTGPYTGLDADEDLVWAPDPLYVVALDDVVVENSDEVLLMEVKPEAVVTKYSFEIKIEGWNRVSKVICHVDGLNGSYRLGKRVCELSKAPIYVETTLKEGMLWGYFSGFALRETARTRAELPKTLTLKIVKRDNTVQEVEVDVTEMVENPPPDGGEEPDNPDDPDDPDNPDDPTPEPDTEIHFELPVIEGEIVVDDLEPGFEEGGGGIGGDVGDWDDETNVELPV